MLCFYTSTSTSIIQTYRSLMYVYIARAKTWRNSFFCLFGHGWTGLDPNAMFGLGHIEYTASYGLATIYCRFIGYLQYPSDSNYSLSALQDIGK